MIAVVFPAGADVATKQDVAAVKGDIAAVKGDIAAVKGDIAAVKGDIALLGAELKSYIDSRLLRYTSTVVIPLCTMMLGAVIAFVIKI